MVAVYPGSFDPITFGHIDIIKRAAALSEKLIVGVLINKSKNSMFSIEERLDMIREAISDMPNVEVKPFYGLTVNFAREEHADCIVRGLRAVTDFEYELQLFQTNKKLAPDIETIFLNTNLKYAYLSSSIVKEVASYNGNIKEFVPEFVEKRIQEKLKAKE